MPKLSIPQFRSDLLIINNRTTPDDIAKFNVIRKKKIRVVYGYKRVENIESSVMLRFPHLQKHWDFKKNIIDPYHIGPNSEIYAWWTCTENHSYRSKVRTRTRREGCWLCESSLRPLIGSLADLHPRIAAEWDYEKNYPLTPDKIKPRKRDKAWWICPIGHSYQASPDNRVGHGSGCAKCNAGGKGKKRKPYRKKINEI